MKRDLIDPNRTDGGLARGRDLRQSDSALRPRRIGEMICLDKVGTVRPENGVRVNQWGEIAELSVFVSLGNVEHLLKHLYTFIHNPGVFTKFIKEYYEKGARNAIASMLMQPHYSPYLSGEFSTDVLELIIEVNRSGSMGANQTVIEMRGVPTLRSKTIGFSAYYDESSPEELIQNSLKLQDAQQGYLDEQVDKLMELSNILSSIRNNYSTSTKSGIDYVAANTELQTWFNFAIATYANTLGIPQIYSTHSFMRDNEKLLEQQLRGEVALRMDGIFPYPAYDFGFPFYAKYSTPWRNPVALVNMMHLLSAFFGNGRFLSAGQLEELTAAENLFHKQKMRREEGSLSALINATIACNVRTIGDTLRTKLFAEFTRRITSREKIYGETLIALFDHIIKAMDWIDFDESTERLLTVMLERVFKNENQMHYFFERYYHHHNRIYYVANPKGVVLFRNTLGGMDIPEFISPTLDPEVTAQLLARHIVAAIKKHSVELDSE